MHQGLDSHGIRRDAPGVLLALSLAAISLIGPLSVVFLEGGLYDEATRIHRPSWRNRSRVAVQIGRPVPSLTRGKVSGLA
jgi:hypothetical protein